MDLDAFLVAVYVVVDDWWKAQHPHERRGRGRRTTLTPSELLCLAMIGHWSRWPTESAYWRFVERHWRTAFPRLCSRPSFNRQVRALEPSLKALQRDLALQLADPKDAYRVLDTTLIPVLHRTRAADHGWFAGQARFGWCAAKSEWVYGFKVGLVITPAGVITSFLLSAANDPEREVGDALLVADGFPCYLGDKGFSGEQWEAHWRDDYGISLVAPPKQSDKRAWTHGALRWSAGKRQVVEQVIGQVREQFGLADTGAHTLSGLLGRLAAKMALSTCCQVLNQQQGRPLRHFADLLVA